MENGISNKKGRKKRNKAYYTVMSLVLTACVLTGAVSWIAYNSHQENKSNEIAQLAATPDNPAANEVGNSLILPLDDDAYAMADATPSACPTGGKKEKKKDKTEETISEVLYPEFIAPVNGSICLEYSMETPVFSETLQEWRTHSGIDIAANLGDSVKCAADGVVQYVKNDPRYGTTVIVDHDSGVNTVYSNLAENVEVKSGQTVVAGDVLGYVGTTSYFECLDTAHLHLEVTANNENVDPTNMFPINK